MNSLILCEGKTDVILISYYLKSISGWKECKKSPSKSLDFKLKENNQYAHWYQKAKDYLLIFGVGGKDNFSNVIDEYIIKILKENPQENSFGKIAIISDSDNDSIECIIDKHKAYLGEISPDIKVNEWTTTSFLDSFKSELSVEILSIIIPPDKQGALETVLLDAISEDTYDKAIVECGGRFIENIKPNAEKYINSDRLTLKAHLSVVFAVMSPEKVFDFIDNLISSVEWGKYSLLKDCFENLCDI